MYLTDEECKIINQALDDAKEMQIKYSRALKMVEEQNDFLIKIIEELIRKNPMIIRDLEGWGLV